MGSILLLLAGAFSGVAHAADLELQFVSDFGKDVGWTLMDVEVGDQLPMLVFPGPEGETWKLSSTLLGVVDGEAVVQFDITSSREDAFPILWGGAIRGTGSFEPRGASERSESPRFEILLYQEGPFEVLEAPNHAGVTTQLGSSRSSLVFPYFEERFGRMEPKIPNNALGWAMCEGDHRRGVSLNQFCEAPAEGQSLEDVECMHTMFFSERGRRLEDHVTGSCTWTSVSGDSFQLDYDVRFE